MALQVALGTESNVLVYKLFNLFVGESGGCLHRRFAARLDGNYFEHRCKFFGVHFPANGPVMQKKTQGWETSTEKKTAYGGVLQGNVPMFLKLEGGGSHRCDFRTTYKAKKDVKMPNSHFVWHRLVRNGDGNTIELQEDGEARYAN